VRRPFHDRSKEAPETVQGFGQMGKAAKTNGALSEKIKNSLLWELL
jgi:hypothetical protein